MKSALTFSIALLFTLLADLSAAEAAPIVGADSASPAPESTGPAGSKPEAQPDNPFERMAQVTAQELKANALFEGMDFEVFVAKPFVVLMTREPGADRGKTDERKKHFDALARGVWRNWLKVRADWQLTSTREDTLENPEPFVWITFHDEAAYARYMKNFKPKETPGSRAFYSTETRFVYSFEDAKREPDIILIHETFHQLMDRFSKTSTIRYQNYCFTEGAPEYFAGHRGSGESLVLGELNRPRRSQEIREIHTHFDAKKKLCYPNAERQRQITPDDWIFFDVPMLLTLRDKMWVRAITRALVEQFKRSDYTKQKYCENFVGGGETSFHSAFYAYAWAFTYWLNQNYPDEYRRYASAVLNTDRGGDAETFLDAFKIQPARPLPDIQSIVGPNNRDVAKNQQKAVACLDERIAILRETPAIQDMHRRWAKWMTTEFPKISDAADGDVSGKTAPPARALATLADDKQPAIGHVIIKGSDPRMIYVPIIHDDQFSKHVADGMPSVKEVMARCETIADHLYNQYAVRNVLLEGVGNEFVGKYNRIPLEKRKPAPSDDGATIVHSTWSRLLAQKKWTLLPGSDKPLVGPLTALGREYDKRIVGVLDAAKQSGWFGNKEIFTENQARLQTDLTTVATEYNAKRKKVLEDDPDLKKEYDITVTRRNKVFLDNLLAPDKPGVAFFGAGHWQDIEAQLEKRGVAYAVVVPKGVPWPPEKKDAAAVTAAMLKLGAKLKKSTLKLGDGASAKITIPIE